MPKISKQNPVSVAAKNGASKGVLSRIQSLSQREYNGLKFVVYGRGKTGKTRLACSFPKPLLLIGTEDGTKSVSNVKGVDFVRIYSSADLGELIELLKTGKYKSVALDTAGGFQDLVLKEVLGLDEVPVSKFKQAGKGESWGITDRATWGTIGTQFKEHVRSLVDLSDTFGMNLITIAHERNFKEDDNSSDLILPTIGAALTPTAAGFVNGAHDYVCQTFIREEKVRNVMNVAGQSVETFTATGKMEYCLRTGPHPIYMTGFRVPVGTKLPDVIVNPDFNKLLKLIKGE